MVNKKKTEQLNDIHPTAIIGDNVIMGRGNIIRAFCVIGGAYVVEGKKIVRGRVVIGNNNDIHEFSRILSPHDTDRTEIGNNNQLFANSFIGHDVRIGNQVFMTAGCRIASNVWIQDKVMLGMGTLVRERLTIGQGARTGMGAVVIRDVLPYEKVVSKKTDTLGLKTESLEAWIQKKRLRWPHRLFMRIWNYLYKIQ